MKIQTTTSMLPLFFKGGLYETSLDPREVFADEYERQAENYEQERYFDMDSYHKQLIKVYQQLLDDLALEAYGIRSIKILSLESPREYNFYTDWFELEVELLPISKSEVRNKIDLIASNKRCMEFYKENYHSHSGFISFFPSTLEEMFEQMYGDDRNRAWSMFLMLKAIYLDLELDLDTYLNFLDFEFEYPGQTISLLPEGGLEVLRSSSASRDELYHKAKDALGWRAWTERKGVDHLAEFLMWCKSKGCQTMNDVIGMLSDSE